MDREHTVHPAIMLAGPTASGKTSVAVDLVQRLPLEIVSVDSVMVYRGMDIGSAKPDRNTLALAPHHLIDIRDPEDNYSAGEFCRDALNVMEDIWRAGRVPLLVGGTMLYFRTLEFGIADLPVADADVRRQLDAEAAAGGWPRLHRRLASIDREAAARIQPNDGQRIQRALEVFEQTGRSLSELQREGRHSDRPRPFSLLKIALIPPHRGVLHERIAERLETMMVAGFLAEVEALHQRPGLTAASASMRAVGYRQLWQYLDKATTLDQARTDAVTATRRLAKRQLTWLRSAPNLHVVNPLETNCCERVAGEVSRFIAGADFS